MVSRLMFPIIANLSLAVTLFAGQTPPRDAATAYKLAVASAEKAWAARDWQTAADKYAEAGRLNPFFGTSFSRAAVADYQLKKYGEAIAMFKRSIELGDRVPSSSAYSISCCYALLGDKPNALIWLKKSLDMGYTDWQPAQTDPDLKSLADDPTFQQLLEIKDISHLSRDEGWRYDLRLMVRQALRVHYSPYHATPKQTFDAKVEQLYQDIPKLTDNQVQVGFMEVMAMLQDGHTHATLDWHTPGKINYLPYRLRTFGSDVTILATSKENEALLGGVIETIDGHPTAEISPALTRLIGGDNPLSAPLASDEIYFRTPQVLNGLGFTKSEKEATVRVRCLDGQIREITMQAPSTQDETGWVDVYKSHADLPYLKNRDKKFWLEMQPQDNTLYCQINEVFHMPGVERFDDFATRLSKEISTKNPDKVVIDLRWNPGGNGYLAKYIVDALVENPSINKRGKLFVIVGRRTFSAAMILAGALQKYTNAIFVGESPATSPNFIGEDNHFTLPYSHMDVSVSWLYHQNGYGNDFRPYLAPELYAPPTLDSLVKGYDPAIEAIKAYIAAT